MFPSEVNIIVVDTQKGSGNNLAVQGLGVESHDELRHDAEYSEWLRNGDRRGFEKISAFYPVSVEYLNTNEQKYVHRE